MKVQRARLPDSDGVTWLVLGDDFLPVAPIDEYLRFLEHTERSPNTRRNYAYHLKLFWEYLYEANLEWTMIGLSEFVAFVAWLRRPHAKVRSIGSEQSRRHESSINTILGAVAAFYDYHHHVGHIPRIPLYQEQFGRGRRYKGLLHHVTKLEPVQTRMIKLTQPARLPKTLTAQQVESLINACHRVRDKFLLQLLYESGMRIGQALGLRHEDIAAWDNAIRIVPRKDNLNGARAKTREIYTVYVPSRVIELYGDYLVNEFNETNSDYVFVNLWDGMIGQPMQYATVIDLFRRLQKRTGIRVTPHMFRHTHATELLRSKNVSLAHVRRRLGHASIQTTIDTYGHLTDEDDKQIHQAFRRKALGDEA